MVDACAWSPGLFSYLFFVRYGIVIGHIFSRDPPPYLKADSKRERTSKYSFSDRELYAGSSPIKLYGCGCAGELMTPA